MAPGSMSPAGSPAGASEGTGCLCVLARYDLAYELAGSSGPGGISAADGANRGHRPLSNRSLLGLIVGVAVAAIGQPVGGHAVQQRGQRDAFAAGLLLERGL